MTTINKLSSVDVIETGDLFPVFSTANMDARKASATVVREYMVGDIEDQITVINAEIADLTLRSISIMDYGAVGDGVADDTIPAQNFFDAVTNGGLMGIIPSGDYLLTSGVTINLKDRGFVIKGAGAEGAVFRVDDTFSTATPAITIEGGTTATYPTFEIGGFSIRSDSGSFGDCTTGLQVGNSGVIKPISAGYNQRVINGVFVADFRTGIEVVHARLVRFDNCSVWNNNLPVINTCLKITQNSTSGGGIHNTGDLVFDKCQFVTSTAAGNKCLHMAGLGGPYNIANGNGSISGIKFRSCDFYAGDKSIHIYATNQSHITDIWFVDGCQIDQEVTNAVFVESNNASALIANLHFDCLYVNKANSFAMAFTSTGSFGFIRDVWVNGCVFYQPQTAAISFAGVNTVIQSVHVTDNVITDCSSTGGAIVFNEVNGITCTGNVARQDVFTNKPNYLVEFQTGCEEIVCTGNKGVVGTDVNVGVVLDSSGTTVGKLIFGNVAGDIADPVVLNVDNFGAKGDGITDDTAVFQALIDAVNAAGGGTICFSKKYLIDSNLTIKDYVTLQGPLGMPGEILPSTSADYDGKRGVLVINSAATITTKSGAGISNCVVMRKGLNLPFADATAATSGIAAFAGTAFTVGGADSSFSHMLVLGFAKAIYSTGYERIRCEQVTGDCTNGIEIRNCLDISYLTRCHFWPFTTVHQAWTTNALLRRSGTAYLFADIADWCKMTDCFSYGYYRGYYISEAASVTLTGCGADNTSTAGVGDHSGSVGFYVLGASTNDIRMIACQAAAQSNGFRLSSNPATSHTKMTNCDVWASSSHAVQIDSGDVTVIGGTVRNASNGFLINSLTSRVFIDGVRFRSITNPVAFNVVNSTTFLGSLNDYSDKTAGQTPIGVPANWPIIQVASADPLPLPVTGDVFEVTGTTSFGTLSGGWRGRRVTLIFTGALTVNDGGASMKLAGSFTTTADDTITLIHNGVAWYEVSRSVN